MTYFTVFPGKAYLLLTPLHFEIDDSKAFSTTKCSQPRLNNLALVCHMTLTNNV